MMTTEDANGVALSKEEARLCDDCTHRVLEKQPLPDGYDDKKDKKLPHIQMCGREKFEDSLGGLHTCRRERMVSTGGCEPGGRYFVLRKPSGKQYDNK